jgi:hypothetical protein
MREKQYQAELQSHLDQLTKEVQWNTVDQFSIPVFSSLLMVTAELFQLKRWSECSALQYSNKWLSCSGPTICKEELRHLRVVCFHNLKLLLWYVHLFPHNFCISFRIDCELWSGLNIILSVLQMKHGFHLYEI